MDGEVGLKRVGNLGQKGASLTARGTCVHLWCSITDVRSEALEIWRTVVGRELLERKEEWRVGQVRTNVHKT